MPLPSPSISNINGTQSDAFRIGDTSGPFGANALILDNNTSAGTLKVLLADGVTLAPVQVAAPSAGDDAANKTYVDSSPAVNSTEQVLAIPLVFGDTSPKASTYTLPNSTYVTKVQVIVTTAFNGTTPTVSVGYFGQATKFMTTAQNNLASVGSYTAEQYTQQNSGSAPAVGLTYTAGGSSAGAATVLVWFVIAPKS
jgi:hypothetical protein